MSRYRLSFSEKRRARLAKKVDRLDRLEPRIPVTEPISFTAMSLGALRGLAQLGIMDAQGGGNRLKAHGPVDGRTAAHGAASAQGQIQFPALTADILPFAVGLRPGLSAGSRIARAADASYQPDAPARGSSGLSADSAGDWLNLSNAASDSTEPGILAPWTPAKSPGGGAAMAPRGGSGAPAAASATAQSGRSECPRPRRAPAALAGGSAALLAAAAGAANSGSAPAGARRARRTRRARQAPERQAARPESPSIPSTAAQSPARAGRRQAQLHTRSRAIPRARAKGHSHTSRSMFWTGTTGR